MFFQLVDSTPTRVILHIENIPASPHAKIFPQTYPSQPPQTQQVAGMYWRLGSIDSHTNNRQSHTQLSPLLFAFTLRSCHLMK